MLNIDDVTKFLTVNFKDQEVTPEQVEVVVKAILSNVKIEYFVEPEVNLKLRYSIGTPIDPETNFNDWKEDFCGTLAELSDEQKTKQYRVYSVWYDEGDDSEDGGELCALEIMLYEA